MLKKNGAEIFVGRLKKNTGFEKTSFEKTGFEKKLVEEY